MRRLKLSLYILFVAGSLQAKAAEKCQDIIGDDQSIEILAGKHTRITFFNRGPDAGYIELCKVTDGHAELVYAAAAATSGWYESLDIPAEKGKFYVKNYAARISSPVPHPWTGMRRDPTPFGYTFKWFESIDDATPNMIVEFCLHDSIKECPSHFPAQKAKNLAAMSQFARDQWLKRWTEKRGHKTEAFH